METSLQIYRGRTVRETVNRRGCHLNIGHKHNIGPELTIEVHVPLHASAVSKRRRSIEDFVSRGTKFSQCAAVGSPVGRSEEHTSELQSLMRISYAVFCLKKK